MKSISYVERTTGEINEEPIFGYSFLNWLYNSFWGARLQPFFCGHLFSRIYAFFQRSKSSKSKITNFIAKYNIDIQNFETQVKDCRHFEDFFLRKYRQGVRPFVSAKEELPAVAEGKYLAYEVSSERLDYGIKGNFYTIDQFLQNGKLTKEFKGGPLIIIRLSVSDYHRYHYPDWGKVISTYSLPGKLHSVGPWANKNGRAPFWQNERRVTLLETQNFGKFLYVEVGALCVGRIVQTHHGHTFTRGEEKGYFRFGGSTIVLIGEKGKWAIDSDLLDNTKQGYETFVQLGTRIGKRLG